MLDKNSRMCSEDALRQVKKINQITVELRRGHVGEAVPADGPRSWELYGHDKTIEKSCAEVVELYSRDQIVKFVVVRRSSPFLY